MKQNRPNILMIIADDLGHQMGCLGDIQARTPNLDAISRNAVMFRNAWAVSPSCSPSRSGMLTGLYPHQNGQIGLSHLGYRMKSGLPNLPGLLKRDGYTTGVIGKVHVEPEKEFVYDFDYRSAVVGTRDIRWSNDRLREFVSGRRDNEPFFLQVSLFDPHREFVDQVRGFPWRVTTSDQVKPFPFLGEVDSTEVNRDIAGFINSVSRVDTGVRMFIDSLEQLGVKENTLVVFAGDNGAPFTRGKTSCYEAGINVPLMFWGCGVSVFHQSSQLVSLVDILPTVLDYAGVACPNNISGFSLRPVLEGRTARLRRYLFSEHTAHQPPEYYPRRAVRDDRYKLILNLCPERGNPVKGVDGCSGWTASRDPRLDGTLTQMAFDTYHQPPAVELYDLQADRWEFTNLADEPNHQRTRQRLLRALRQWREQTSDPLLDLAKLEWLSSQHDKLTTYGDRWDGTLVASP